MPSSAFATVIESDYNVPLSLAFCLFFLLRSVSCKCCCVIVVECFSAEHFQHIDFVHAIQYCTVNRCLIAISTKSIASLQPFPFLARRKWAMMEKERIFITGLATARQNENNDTPFATTIITSLLVVFLHTFDSFAHAVAFGVCGLSSAAVLEHCFISSMQCCYCCCCFFCRLNMYNILCVVFLFQLTSPLASPNTWIRQPANDIEWK